jgi:hypothetical protein
VLALAKHLRDRTYERGAVGADHPLYGQRWDALDEHARRFYLREARAQLERAAALLGFAGISSQILASTGRRRRTSGTGGPSRPRPATAARPGPSPESTPCTHRRSPASARSARSCTSWASTPIKTPGQAQDVPAEDPRPGG